jgi:hypothetical protein
MRYLAEHENLDEMVARLSSLRNRPVFVASCLNIRNYGPPLFKRPGGTGYEKVDALEAFLSTWRVLDYDHKTSPKGRDLAEANVVHVVYPLRLDEHYSRGWLDQKGDDFVDIDLHDEINSNRSVVLTNDLVVPDALSTYVAEYSDDRRGKYKPPIRGILFAISESVVRPRLRKVVWHVGYEGEINSGGVRSGIIRAATLYPPGHYSGRAITSSDGVNNVVVLKKTPGSCVVCRGRSKECVHIAFLDYGQLACFVCRACAKNTFSAWQGIMDEWAE